MIGKDRYEREGNEFDNSTGRPESPKYRSLIDHNLNSNLNSRENEIRRLAEDEQLPCEISSGNNSNHLSGELNRRITQKMNWLLNINVHIQRTFNEAINKPVCPNCRLHLGP